jgi:hypothetical protein
MRIWSTGMKTSRAFKLPQWLLDLDLGKMSRKRLGLHKAKRKEKWLSYTRYPLKKVCNSPSVVA